jgi:uncharacterized protein
MYSSSFVPEPLVTVKMSSVQPDYIALLQFLIEPFLESPESLKIDCEASPSKARIWIRLAFEGSDKGRVFGRGGRNIQAIRTVLEAVAKAAGYSAHLEIYGSQSQGREGGDREFSADKPVPRRNSGSRPSPKARSQFHDS